MYQFPTIFITLCALFLYALAAPLQADAFLMDKRTTHTGRGTWFNVGHGACGEWNTNNDPVVAIGAGRFGTGGNCGQWVHITNTANGNSVYGQTLDECESCDTESLDLSPSLFSQLADLSVGEITIEWNFMSMDWSP